jgi:hypothetical protein
VVILLRKSEVTGSLAPPPGFTNEAGPLQAQRTAPNKTNIEILSMRRRDLLCCVMAASIIGGAADARGGRV